MWSGMFGNDLRILRSSHRTATIATQVHRIPEGHQSGKFGARCPTLEFDQSPRSLRIGGTKPTEDAVHIALGHEPLCSIAVNRQK